MMNTTSWFLILKWRDFHMILFWVSNKLINWDIAHLLHSPQTYSNDLSVSWLVGGVFGAKIGYLCNFLSDTVEFEKKLDYRSSSSLTSEKYKTSFSEKNHSKCYTFIRLTLYIIIYVALDMLIQFFPKVTSPQGIHAPGTCQSCFLTCFFVLFLFFVVCLFVCFFHSEFFLTV